MSVIKLQAKDGEVIEVEEEIARECETLKDMLDIPELREDEEPIQVSKLDSCALKKVLLWISHHKDDPPIEDDTEISEWDEGFLRVDKKVLLNTMEAANILKIPKLSELLVKHFLEMVKGKSLNEIWRMFHFENDGIPEEEEEVMRESSDGSYEAGDEVEIELEEFYQEFWY